MLVPVVATIAALVPFDLVTFFVCRGEHYFYMLVCCLVPTMLCCHFCYVRCNTTIHGRRRNTRVVRGWHGPCQHRTLLSAGRWVARAREDRARVGPQRSSGGSEDSDGSGSVELSVLENRPLVQPHKPYGANEYELRENFPY